MANIIQLKRGTDAAIQAATLKYGEIAVATDTYKIYFGEESGTKKVLNPEGGVASEAAKLSVPREIALAGMATGSTSFDGSENVTINVTLAEIGEASEKLYAVATDAYGRVISGVSELQITDITGLQDAIDKNLQDAKDYADEKDGQVKTELIGTSSTGASATTIKGAVDEAKTYADTQIAEKVASVYKPAGSVEFASLPEPAEELVGNVYNITDAFTTNDKFVEGAGQSYGAGTNVVVIEVTGGEPDPAYKFDVLGGFISLENYLTKDEASSTYATKVEVSAIGDRVTTVEGKVTNIENALGGSIPDSIVKTVSAGNGIEVSGDGKDVTVSAKVVAQNGLSVDSNGIAMAVGSDTAKGAVQVDNVSIKALDGVISVGDIDCGVIES